MGLPFLLLQVLPLASLSWARAVMVKPCMQAKQVT